MINQLDESGDLYPTMINQLDESGDLYPTMISQPDNQQQHDNNVNNKKRKSEDINHGGGAAIQIPRTIHYEDEEELELTLSLRHYKDGNDPKNQILCNGSRNIEHSIHHFPVSPPNPPPSRPISPHFVPSLTPPPPPPTAERLIEPPSRTTPPPPVLALLDHAQRPPPPPQQPRPVRQRKHPTQQPGEGKSETVPPPFPWATDKRAMVHTLNELRAKQIFVIYGDVQCKRCERQYKMEFDLEQKFYEVGKFVLDNKAAMHDRAPEVWKNPVLPTCSYCEQENSAKPIIATSKKAINWLFLLLGQLLGCCTLEQLRYFCKHTKNHRTGAKDRVLYLTYLTMCKQLDPDGPFDR